MDFLFSILKQRRIVLATRLEQTKSGYYDVAHSRCCLMCEARAVPVASGSRSKPPQSKHSGLVRGTQQLWQLWGLTSASASAIDTLFAKRNVSRTFNLIAITSQLSVDSAAPSRVT